jgi:hypothetical protein
MDDDAIIEGKTLLELHQRVASWVAIGMGLVASLGGVALARDHLMPGLVGLALGIMLFWIAQKIVGPRVAFTTEGIDFALGGSLVQKPSVVQFVPWSAVEKVSIVVDNRRSGDRLLTTITLVVERRDGEPVRQIIGWPPGRRKRAALTRLCAERSIPVEHHHAAAA